MDNGWMNRKEGRMDGWMDGEMEKKMTWKAWRKQKTVQLHLHQLRAHQFRCVMRMPMRWKKGIKGMEARLFLQTDFFFFKCGNQINMIPDLIMRSSWIGPDAGSKWPLHSNQRSFTNHLHTERFRNKVSNWWSPFLPRLLLLHWFTFTRDVITQPSSSFTFI